MATHRSQRDNADAFDDLLGQLVDELAMQPTMVPEVEPTPAPAPVAVAPVVYQIPMQEAPPARSNVMGIAIGGGIAIAGIAIALVMMGRAEPPPVPQQAVVAAVTPPVAPKPVQPVPAPVAVPVTTPPVLPVGTGLPGQAIDPGALAQAGSPAVPDPVGAAATSAPKKPPKKVVTAPKKKPPASTPKKVIDPFE